MLEALEHGGAVHLDLAHRAVELVAIVGEELKLEVPEEKGVVMKNVSTECGQGSAQKESSTV